MLVAVRSTSCAPASENATRELVGSAMSNPSAWVHGRDMASPRSCCYWPYGQGEGSPRAKSTDRESQRGFSRPKPANAAAHDRLATAVTSSLLKMIDTSLR